MKRGQATIFIILGLVIVILIGIALYLSSDVLQTENRFDIAEQEILAEEVEEYYEAISDCLPEATNIALLEIGQQGGYYDVPEPYFDTGFNKVPYLFYEGERVSEITVETFGEELIKELEFEMDYCVALYVENYSNIEVDYDNYEGTCRVNENSLEVEVILPVKINLDEQIYDFEYYSYDLEIDIYEIFEIKNQILEIQEELGNYLPLSELIEIEEESNIEIGIANEENDVFFTLTDMDSELGSMYDYNFIIKYEWVEEE